MIQYIAIDSNDFILGINQNGIEVDTDVNCSYCWVDDAPAYKLVQGYVVETTDAERDAYRHSHPQDDSDRLTDIELALAELAEMIVSMTEA